MKLYGNVMNRISEGKNQDMTLEVGTDITMYYFSDRTCYYITRVNSQKDIYVRIYETKSLGAYSNDWEYIKNSDYREEHWVKRYRYWNREVDGRYERLLPISFGVRDYYYDYSF